jgi:hypothetical protein
MNAYVIVGDDDSFKSSTIRSLTGCRIRGPRKFNISGKITETFVQLSSLSEVNNLITPANFIEEVEAKDVEACIFPLRAMMYRGRPDANSYLNLFIAHGWNIKGLAVLHSPGFTLKVTSTPTNISLYPTINNPKYYSNEIASKVRSQFLWV